MSDLIFVVVLVILCALMIALFVMYIRIVLSPQYAAEEARMESLFGGKQ